LLLSVALITSGYLYQYFFKEVIEHHIKVEDCQISKSSCSVEIAQGKSLTIDISPKGMIATKPMDINVNFKGITADEVMMQFEGVEIDHNLPNYYFDEINLNHFYTKGFISLCTLRSMNWFANLIFYSDGALWKVSFPFETHRIAR